MHTERLDIRPFAESDLAPFAELMADPQVMQFSLKGPLNKNQSQDYLRRILDSYAANQFGLYALVNLKTGQFIGFAGLTKQQIDGTEHVELGYRLHPDFWGKGFATEAAQAIVSHAFNELHIPLLISIIDPKNHRSIKLAQRVGMRFWKNATYNGIPVEIFSLTSN